MGRTIGDFFQRQADRTPDKTFLHFQDREISFADMDRRASCVARGLRERGIRKGDHVALFLPNCPEFLELWFGIAKLGVTLDLGLVVAACAACAGLAREASRAGAHALQGSSS